MNENTRALLHAAQAAIEASLVSMREAKERSTEPVENAGRGVEAADANELAPLPPDGRYQLGNDTIRMDLRIDLAGSNLVSGDVFAEELGHHEHLASFRSRPGLELLPETNPVPLVGEDESGRRAQGELSVALISNDELTVAVAFDSVLKGLPVNLPISFVGRRRSDAMRELGIELEYEEGADTAISWTQDGRTFTIESCLEDAGFEVFNVGVRSQIPTPSGHWDDSQLHGLMTQFAQEDLDRREWNLHLLMLQQSSMLGLNGVMFDSGDRDLNRLPRQGAAVFQNEIKFPIIDAAGNRLPHERPDWQRKTIQTVVHELGHALNLAHRFERPVGRADSTSFMNYDWRYLGGQNRDNYWREFAFTFDADELAFMRHGPLGAVIPGGAEFHTIPYWENTDGGYSPYRIELPTHEFSLRLIAPDSGALFSFGQPVLLTVELTNQTAQPMDIPMQVLDPKTGFLELIVKRQTALGGGGDNTLFRPIVHRCFELAGPAADIVPPGESLRNNVNITFGSSGFTFAEPGNYEITAVFAIPLDRRREVVVRSAPLAIRIANPASVEEERDALVLLRSDVGYYFALGGSDVLAQAESDLEEIVSQRQFRKRTVRDPVVVNIKRCQAINLGREFVRYQDGKFSIRRKKTKASQDLFAQIAKPMQTILDRASSELTQQLIKTAK